MPSSESLSGQHNWHMMYRFFYFSVTQSSDCEYRQRSQQHHRQSPCHEPLYSIVVARIHVVCMRHWKLVTPSCCWHHWWNGDQNTDLVTIISSSTGVLMFFSSSQHSSSWWFRYAPSRLHCEEGRVPQTDYLKRWIQGVNSVHIHFGTAYSMFSVVKLLLVLLT